MFTSDGSCGRVEFDRDRAFTYAERHLVECWLRVTAIAASEPELSERSVMFKTIRHDLETLMGRTPEF